MENSGASEKLLARELEETLETLPGIGVVRSRKHGDRGYDIDMEFELDGQPNRLLVECKRIAYPRDLREFAPLWAKLAVEKNAVPMLATESISLPMREELRRLKVGYFDLGGSLYLPLTAGGYIWVDRPPPSRNSGRPDVFHGKALRIVHHLLTDASGWHRVTEIARLCGVAPSTASRTLAQLEREDWVEGKGAGPYKERRAAQPGAMLDAWVEAARGRPAPTFARFFVPGASGAEGVVRRLAEAFRHRSKYAITHQAGAQMIAPWLTGVSLVRMRALTDEGTLEALRELRAQPVDEGANLEMLQIEEPLDIFTEESLGDVAIATPVQMYVDLLQGGEGRSKEQAQKLRSEKIQY